VRLDEFAFRHHPELGKRLLSIELVGLSVTHKLASGWHGFGMFGRPHAPACYLGQTDASFLVEMGVGRGPVWRNRSHSNFGFHSEFRMTVASGRIRSVSFTDKVAFGVRGGFGMLGRPHAPTCYLGQTDAALEVKLGVVGAGWCDWMRSLFEFQHPLGALVARCSPCAPRPEDEGHNDHGALVARCGSSAPWLEEIGGSPLILSLASW
jgi:hypothetical protein